MTHEFKEIITQALINQQVEIQNVLATVVHLEGSSYRKPGVRMLVASDGKMFGAVSGGCVEKEIQRCAQTVFKKGIAKVMLYDGRHRLGCEGVLYILLEPFYVFEDFALAFASCLRFRKSFQIQSYYQKKEIFGSFGSIIQFEDGKRFSFSKQKKDVTNLVFSQKLHPIFQLLIVGGGYDAVQLSKQAILLGWEVSVIISVKNEKDISNFPKTITVTVQTPELYILPTLNQYTGVVLMNHNFTNDLRWLIKLQQANPIYIGIIGAIKRREKLFDSLFEFVPNTSDKFLEKIYTPAGLHIGAITAEEIALSIVAEILSVMRNIEVCSLKKITGNIHTK